MTRATGGLREFVETLEKQGDIRRITKAVDSRYEAAAILSEMSREDAPAVVFENIRNHAMPLVGNLLGAKRRLALALCIEEEALLRGRLPNREKRIDPVLLDDDRQDRTVIPADGTFDIRSHLPILTHYVRDSAPFITCGIASARDPHDGGMRRGLHRLEVRAGAELGISLVHPPLASIYAAHRKAGTRMEIAVAVGVDPAVLIATVLKMPGDVDKLAAAGGLTGEAVPLVKAATADLDIPAWAEVVIEGYIDPAETEKEGTLGEVSGYYLAFSSPTIHITAISLRKDPLFQALLPQSLEVDHLLTFMHGLNVIPKMKREFPAIREVHFTPGTFGSHAVMSIDSDNPGEIRRALTMALSFPNIKKAVMVNDDVDPRDLLAVEWAMATRFQADRDLFIIPSLGGQAIDPSSGPAFQTAKVAIDATRPDRHGFEKIGFPEGLQG